MADFLDALNKGRAKRQAAAVAQETKEAQERDAAKQAREARDRWVDQQLLPLLNEAKEDLASGATLIFNQKSGPDVSGFDIFLQPTNVSAPKASKIGAVNVLHTGLVNTYTGAAGKAESAGDIGNANTIIKVSRVLQSWISDWAQSN